MTHQFCIHAGDTKSLPMTMMWEGQPFDPGTDWALLFTAKRKSSDVDTAAIFQKTSEAGISWVGESASIEVVEPDTNLLIPVILVIEIRAQHRLNGSRRVVASGQLKVERPINLNGGPSIPIHTANPPVRGDAVVYNRVDGNYYLMFIGEAEDGSTTIQTELYSIAPVDAAAPVIENRMDGKQWLLFLGDDGTGTVTLQAELVP